MNRHAPLTWFAIASLAAVTLTACGDSDDADTGLATTPAPTSGAAAPTDATPPTGAPTPGALPEELLDRWYGPPRDLGSLGKGTAASYLVFDNDQLVVESGNADNPEVYPSTAVADGPDGFELTLLTDTFDCQAGAVGHYGWSLSPAGKTLTVTSVDDECPQRAEAITGGWWFTGCWDPTRNCLGVVEGGTYATNRWNPFGDFTYGELTFTLPDDTLAVAYDSQAAFFLDPAEQYSGDVIPVLAAWTDVDAASQTSGCSPQADPTIDDTAVAIADWIETLPTLEVARTDVEIGGLPAIQLDIDVAPGDVPCSEGYVVLTLGQPGDEANGAGRGQHMRLFLLDVAPHKTVAIYIDDWGLADKAPELDADGNDVSFPPLADTLMPIIDSFEFHATPPDVGPIPAV